VNRVMVRYQVHPDRVEENTDLVRAVYAELAATRPAGFRYSTHLCDDGVTFVHLAVSHGPAPLPELAAFQRFQAGIVQRCAVAPVVTTLTEIGAYVGGEP
jgi:class 3 adenylate cyclase